AGCRPYLTALPHATVHFPKPHPETDRCVILLLSVSQNNSTFQRNLQHKPYNSQKIFQIVLLLPKTGKIRGRFLKTENLKIKPKKKHRHA
ncbi:MAG: hypothetical protein IJ465_02310, partial [Clostridia bacterium]|nr:hypothetical protein [Clostridia bacterium]